MAPPQWQLANAPLMFLIIALDGLDGYVARRRGEVSAFGAIFDIAVDRVVENVMWVVLANLDLVPLWVAIVFITRGSLVDSIRYSAIKQGDTAFGMMRTAWGRFLVAGRFMRGFYGALKAATFGWILLVQPWPQLDPASWSAWSDYAGFVSALLIHASVIVCLARGIPVVLEFILSSDLFSAAPRWTKRPG
jgi:CDP-diacylglycerol--glycerol-3-phosphate 3-phosphatidyltransferase